MDHKGHVVFEGIGNLKAAGLTLNALRDKISSHMEKITGSEVSFQIEVTNFSSQSALVNVPGKDGGLIPITDIPVALDEILTNNGLSVSGDKITRINLQRKGISYIFTLNDLFDLGTQKIFLEPHDRITI